MANAVPKVRHHFDSKSQGGLMLPGSDREKIHDVIRFACDFSRIESGHILQMPKFDVRISGTTFA